MASSISFKKPKDAGVLLKQFTALSMDEKMKHFKRYLEDYYRYDSKEIPLELSSEQMEMAYTKIGFERDKAYMRIVLLGQLIEQDKLKELLPNDEDNMETCFNKVIFQKITSLKKSIEVLESTTSPEYPDLCKYIVSRLKEQLYNKCISKFNIYQEITESITEYIAQNRIESHKISSLPKKSKDEVYLQMNEKFYSVIECNRFEYVDKPEDYNRMVESQKNNILSDEESYLEDEEEEDSSMCDGEEGDDEEEYEEIYIDGNSHNDDNIISVSNDKDSSELKEDKATENCESPSKTSSASKRTVEDDSDIEIVGYGKCAKFSNESNSAHDEIECIIISDDE
uniref:Tegument protein UL51 homolog n=1 Tax=Strongyloides venezuelensis TaxID=75913 RepID=A0A0K0FND2_STRVS